MHRLYGRGQLDRRAGGAVLACPNLRAAEHHFALVACGVPHRLHGDADPQEGPRTTPPLHLLR
eukprot:5016878-Lingulodinium_polyedra.AAC.1